MNHHLPKDSYSHPSLKGGGYSSVYRSRRSPPGPHQRRVCEVARYAEGHRGQGSGASPGG